MLLPLSSSPPSIYSTLYHSRLTSSPPFLTCNNKLPNLITSVETIKQEEKNIQRFSEHMIYVRELIIKLQSQQSGSQSTHSSATGNLLQRMEIAINNARKDIELFKSRNSLSRFLYSRSVLFKLKHCSNEIAEVLRLLPLTSINTSLDIKSNLEAIIHSLKYMELKLEERANAIHSTLDLYLSENSASPSPRMIKDDQQVKIGESINKENQFTQMLECLSSARVSPTQRESSTVDEIGSPPSIFFYCVLTARLMEDPVIVSCNHSYERKAIEEYFSSGHKSCKLCGKELKSSSSGKLELTPNPTLLNNISEWKQRNARFDAEKNAKMKLRDAAERIRFDDMEATSLALEELKAVMEEVPSCISAVSESSCKLCRNLAELLKKGAGNTGLVLRCILYIARFSHKNRETIGREGVIKCLLKQVKTEPIAVEILLELSTNDRVAKKITETKNSIPVLAFLLNSPNSHLAENARAVMKNLPASINNSIMMAKSGYLTPFLHDFNAQGISEAMRAFMAEELAQMQLTEPAACDLNNEHFIAHLTVMLTCSSSASQLASLNCIKRLLDFNVMKTTFLSTFSTVANLLCIITDTAAEQQSKKQAFEILILLIEKSQTLELQSYPGLQRLYSHSTIQNLLEQINGINPDEQLWLLRLLLAMCQNSDTSRDLIVSDEKAMNHLFSALNLDENNQARFIALKLVYYLTCNCPNDIPLKETTLRSLIAILTKSCRDEEVSIAANIISHLPHAGNSIDTMLQNSSVLTYLHAQISHANKSNEFLENALGAMLWCINQSNLGSMIQVSKFEEVFVRMLSASVSSLVKQLAAMILAHLARCTPEPSTSLINQISFYNPFSTRCTVHDCCSEQRLVCLVKAGAVTPLIDMVGSVNPGASEAALMALDTLFCTANQDSSIAANIIVENKGAAPILRVLERGTLPVKKAALELFAKIYKHLDRRSEELGKFKALLLSLLNKEDELKTKAKSLLADVLMTC